MEKKLTLNFVRLQPLLGVSFYMEYQKRVIDTYKFDDYVGTLYGFYEISSTSTFLRFEDYSFDLKNCHVTSGKEYYLKGLFYHVATYENFSNLNIYEEIDRRINIDKDNFSFVLIMYGDIKNYTFHVYFSDVETKLETKITSYKYLSSVREDLKISHFINKDVDKNLVYYVNWSTENRIFIYDINSNPNNIPFFLKSAINEVIQSTNNNSTENQEIKIDVILFKDSTNISNNLYKNSVVLNISLSKVEEIDKLNIKYVKKEMLLKSLKMFDLKKNFNPKSILENSVDLNINLMKWRMAPTLNTDIIKSTKFLLVGAGTLGCSVSRCLLGWGVRHIDFIDNSKVSYSNPVRQSLYRFEDINREDNYKALIAAERLKEIFPTINANGHHINIPLPGTKLINEGAETYFLKEFEKLDNLIMNSDVIFLLTDSRETRWLPTLLCAAYNKICITTALGFDSFIVMKHGNRSNKTKLGCYFCNDIVSPIDTSRNRTLDQQCTISRPGLSAISSGIAAEIAISSLQNDSEEFNGISPHTIRGNIYDYNILKLESKAFKNCVACSDYVIEEFLKDKKNMLLSVMNDTSYLENICGVRKMIEEINIEDVEVLHEDDF